MTLIVGSSDGRSQECFSCDYRWVVLPSCEGGRAGGRQGGSGGLADVCLIAGGGLPVFVLKEKKKPK